MAITSDILSDPKAHCAHRSGLVCCRGTLILSCRVHGTPRLTLSLVQTAMRRMDITTAATTPYARPSDIDEIPAEHQGATALFIYIQISPPNLRRERKGLRAPHTSLQPEASGPFSRCFPSRTCRLIRTIAALSLCRSVPAVKIQKYDAP